MTLNTTKLAMAIGNAKKTVFQLSDETGLAVSTISKIKNGRRSPRLDTIGKIADALQVRIEDLVD